MERLFTAVMWPMNYTHHLIDNVWAFQSAWWNLVRKHDIWSNAVIGDVLQHARNRMLSPVDFERQQEMKAEGVLKTRGYSVG
jgi:hypothetical protein